LCDRVDGVREVDGAATWDPAPARPVATSAEVHVWRVSLDLPTALVERFEQALSDDERMRASRFFFARDRHHFVVARGTLRAILGGYLGLSPGDVAFAYASHGKPAVRGGPDRYDLRFNVSHAGGLALVAIALGREVGVDIEQIREDFATEEIAARFFSPAEVAAIRALPVEERCAAFFNCWTRKEAYVKARGEGLLLPLHRFEVSVAPGDPAALLATADDPREPSRWALRELTPGPGYAAALAVDGRGWRPLCWQWPEP
jgi:4'-phosphopantetheinyl transferase